MKLNNKSVVVTGASSGMGKAIVELFAHEGANIIAVARRAERLEALRDSLADAPGTVIPFTGDVSRQETMEQAIDLAVEKFGRLDVLINNAGVMDDMSGIDVRYNVLTRRLEETGVKSYGYDMISDLYQQGRYGKKVKHGFYDYE